MSNKYFIINILQLSNLYTFLLYKIIELVTELCLSVIYCQSGTSELERI